MVNMLILFSKFLTSSGYIFDYLWLCLASVKGTKHIDRGTCIAAAGIWSKDTKGTCISSIYVVGTLIECFSIDNTYTKDIYAKDAFIRVVD